MRGVADRKEVKQMRRRLSNYEQETIINFNKDEAIAHIFTYEKTWQQHLEKKLGLNPQWIMALVVRNMR